MQSTTQSLTVVAKILRNRLFSRAGSTSAGRRVTPDYEERPKQSLMGSCEIHWYIISFLTIFSLCDKRNTKPELSSEILSHQKALERLELEKLASAGDSSD